ncbi:hypothetical protein AQUCO_01100378v1 [Aquilegia coerulea]|uniref:Uncharacterized protein n=1 Tax=Aquilegia coerulea TaxID=218851 RepID=A0A2G5E6W4_AQUCA|nr:hypothetical protein AQUCO_01100378v1 [Aquilegia coerulea]
MGRLHRQSSELSLSLANMICCCFPISISQRHFVHACHLFLHHCSRSHSKVCSPACNIKMLKNSVILGVIRVIHTLICSDWAAESGSMG